MKPLFLLLTLAALLPTASLAEYGQRGSAPPCLDNQSRELPINNEIVAEWKRSAPDRFKARTHVRGVVRNIYPDRRDVLNGHSNHHHFQLEIGPGNFVEIVFNEDFGRTPAIRSGMNVEVCGDYINSRVPAPPYPASPDGGIIHWVHRSMNLRRHQDGYINIDGVTYGLEFPQRR